MHSGPMSSKGKGRGASANTHTGDQDKRYSTHTITWTHSPLSLYCLLPIVLCALLHGGCTHHQQLPITRAEIARRIEACGRTKATERQELRLSALGLLSIPKDVLPQHSTHQYTMQPIHSSRELVSSQPLPLWMCNSLVWLTGHDVQAPAGAPHAREQPHHAPGGVLRETL